MNIAGHGVSGLVTNGTGCAITVIGGLGEGDMKSDNIFDLGNLYQAIMDLRSARTKVKQANIRKDIDKAIGKLKTLLKAEVDKI